MIFILSNILLALSKYNNTAQYVQIIAHLEQPISILDIMKMYVKLFKYEI